MEFAKGFDAYVCPGDTIETILDGITYTARIERDQCATLDDDDCHNIDQSVTGCNDEQQEKLLKARTAWFGMEWWYCGVVISASKDGIEINDHAASLWGIEANYPDSDNAYLLDVANELLPEAVLQAKADCSRIIDTLTSVA